MSWTIRVCPACNAHKPIGTCGCERPKRENYPRPVRVVAVQEFDGRACSSVPVAPALPTSEERPDANVMTTDQMADSWEREVFAREIAAQRLAQDVLFGEAA